MTCQSPSGRQKDGLVPPPLTDRYGSVVAALTNTGGMAATGPAAYAHLPHDATNATRALYVVHSTTAVCLPCANRWTSFGLFITRNLTGQAHRPAHGQPYTLDDVTGSPLSSSTCLEL